MIRRNPILLTLCIALVTIGAGVALTACGGGDEVTLTAGEPQVLSESQLSDFAGEQSDPVYWLGARDGAEYEVTETPQGRIYVRYLEGGAEAGDPRAKFLTVGTYPTADGVAALHRALANRDGAKLARTDDGAVLLVDPASPQNAHLAYPGQGVQVEVFSPVPGAALRLASAGDVQPVP